MQQSADVRQMLARVREPLLELLSTSPDFRPACDPLLTIADALAAGDTEGARMRLLRLAELQRARLEAEVLLAQLLLRGR
jgi:spermidine synthase